MDEKSYPYSPGHQNNETSIEAAELIKAGANDSLTHVDFMVGTKDLDIVGVKADGVEILVFKNGNFLLETN